MVRKTHFLTFGDGSSAYRIAGRRVAEQARNSGLFDSIWRYDLMRLRKEYPVFWRKNRKFILDPVYRRGLGYWCWKSFLVHATLLRMNEGDVLFYCDAGCELDLASHAQIAQARVLLDSPFSAVLFDGRVEDVIWTVGEWTNRLTLSAMAVLAEDLARPQVVATAFFIKKCSVGLTLAAAWLKWTEADNHVYLVDHPTIDELPEYVQHRHDQALLALLVFDQMRADQNSIQLQPAQLIERDPGYFIHAYRSRGVFPRLRPQGFKAKAQDFFVRQSEKLWRHGRIDGIYLKFLRVW